MKPKTIKWENISYIVFDFDGIFTNNKVYVNERGEESVRCERGDGLGFDILRKFMDVNKWHPEIFILSKEKNPVVLQRAKKLRLSCHFGIEDKEKFLQQYFDKTRDESEMKIKGLAYIGNDLNDLRAIQLAEYSICPKDSHPIIKEEAMLTLESKGGEGCVREFIETILRIEEMDRVELLSFI